MWLELGHSDIYTVLSFKICKKKDGVQVSWPQGTISCLTDCQPKADGQRNAGSVFIGCLYCISQHGCNKFYFDGKGKKTI